MDFFIPANISRVLDRLENRGYESYLVGGCVRDSLLGKKPKDYDIATSATPNQIRNCFPDYTVIETGIKHGTMTIVSDNENVEVTTFRVDGEYTDFRRPEKVIFSDKLNDDLSRRDFTINAMAYSESTGLIDNFGGNHDLFKRTIKCVGEPAVRFHEDALRIMRALRLASVLEFEIDDLTSVAIHDLKRLLLNVSAERIAKELELILCGIGVSKVLLEYSDVFVAIIPEFKNTIGFNQYSRYHVYDVWTHTAISLQHSAPQREVRLALFMHDISKPECFKLDDEGNGHFPNHEKLGAEAAKVILKRLHYDNDTIKIVTMLIKYHYITPIDDKIIIKHLLSILGEDNYFKLMEVMKGDNHAKHSLCFERLQTLNTMTLKATQILCCKECISLSMLDINGDDIIGLGVSGKAVGDILSYLLKEVINENVSNTHEDLLTLAKKRIR